MDLPPPVVDVARQARIETVIQESGSGSSPIFNIAALVVIAIALFFLYKRYKDKQETTRVHMLRPSPVIPKPVVEVAEVEEKEE